MILLGVIVNTVAIMIGAIFGQSFTRIREDMKETIIKALAIAIVVLGLGMSLQGAASEYFLIALFSLVLGGVLGEWLNLEGRLELLGAWLERKVGSNRGNVAKAFVTTTLIYTIGAMGVVGSLDSGLRADHTVLYTKAFIDGFTAIIFSSTLGIGVIFSAIPVLIYQGAITLSANLINYLLPEQLILRVIEDLTTTGGILIIAIGLNMLGITKIKVGNLLPALLVASIVSGLIYYIQPLF